MNFYANPGHFCAESVFQSAVNYYFSGKEMRTLEARKLFGNKNKRTHVYPVQIANALSDLGLSVSYFSCFDLEGFLKMNREEKIEEYKKFYGDFSEKIVSHTEFDSLDENISRIISRGYEKRELDFSDIENYFQNSSVICLLNNDLFYLRENQYTGHYAVITDISGDYVKYHEVGPASPEPDKKVSKKRFSHAWNKMCFFDEDTIVIGGKRNGISK
ncbi:Uncharacterised protein [uncultured archaeon]|nr:Uncharacterised protein [uncultured archaeon]